MPRKIKISATTDDFEQAGQDQGDFVVPPAGYYILQCKEINPGFSQDDDGNADKKRPRLEVIYSITGVGVEDNPVTENYGNIWDYVSFSAASGFARARFLRAFGFAGGDEAFDGEIDIDKAINMKVVARLRQVKGREPGEKRAKIASLLPYEDRHMAEAFGGGDDDESDSAEDGAVFGGTAEDAGEAYTQEELEGMDLKELGGVAKDDFSLDPNDFIVKVRGKVNADKTKAAVIEGILAAQEAEDAEGGSGDDDEGESPF